MRDVAATCGKLAATAALAIESWACRKPGPAFGLFVDEMQDLDEATFGGLTAAQHATGQREWPFYIIAAELPNLPRVLTETRFAQNYHDGTHGNRMGKGRQSRG